MKKTSRYAFGKDGRLWTLYNGLLRRPSSVEEMEGYCREIAAVPYHSFRAYLPAREPEPLPVAV